MRKVSPRRILFAAIGLIVLTTGMAYFIRLTNAATCPTTSVKAEHPISPDLVGGNNDFAFSLYAQLASTQEGNFVYSPYSISQAFAMVYLGADGDTKTQMAKTLHFTLPATDIHAELESLNNIVAANAEQSESAWCNANAVWLEKTYPVNPDYVAQVAKYYGAGIQLADFKDQPETARQAINQWVQQQTKGRIDELFKPGTVTSDTKLALINAIYFKSQWQYAFDRGATKNENFTLLDGSKVTVPMMHTEKSNSLNFAWTDGYMALELPYKNGSTMMIVVPRQGKFKEVEASINSQFLKGIPFNRNDINASLPRFEFDSSFDVAKTLKTMGLVDAFDPSRANFSKMAGSNDLGLFIGQALHKAFIKTDEEGSEAAASSGVVMMLVSSINCCTIDRPFIFVIRDQQTQAILFMGRVLNPLSGH